MGFPLRPTGGGEHETRAEDLDSSLRVRDHLVAYHLAPAITEREIMLFIGKPNGRPIMISTVITDFISDENRVC